MSAAPTHSDAPVSSRRYAGASAAERQVQRRERLVDAAFDVFGREGYRAATMRLICAQARLTDRYFYENFATIDDVFMAVHKRLSVEVASRIMAQALVQPDDPVAQTRAGLRAFFEYIKEDPRRAQILLIDASSYWRHITIKTNPELTKHAGAMRHFSMVV